MLSYTDIKKAHFRNIGKAGQFSDATLMEDFQYALGNRYQLIWDNLSSYINADSPTGVTALGTQYYTYPVGTQTTDTATITIGTRSYPLRPIYSQQMWDQMNAITSQPTGIPQYIFPRLNDFGIYPIPQDAYPMTLNRFFRDRNMMVEDYSDGNIAVTSGLATIVGTGTTWTEAMVGRYLVVTDISKPGQGYWYKITGFTDATHITLASLWASTTQSGLSYRIGECPQLPEGAHVLLPNGTAADFYSGLRNNSDEATRFDNLFWTGSMASNSRDKTNKNINSGLIGLIRNYADRDRDRIINRDPFGFDVRDTVWGTTIT